MVKNWLHKTPRSKPIYMVGVFNHPTSVRTLGWFGSEQEANLAVKNNESDIHENYYEYVVVEKFYSGLYPFCFTEGSMWYKWDSKKKKYLRKSKAPQIIEKLKVINLTLG